MSTSPSALLVEATRKSAVLWLAVGDNPPRAVWHVWSDGAAYVLHGGGEQDVPGLGQALHAVVSVRSKHLGGRLLDWTASVTEVPPHSEDWTVLIPSLVKSRQSLPDLDNAPNRWAISSTLSRLTPTSDGV